MTDVARALAGRTRRLVLDRVGVACPCCGARARRFLSFGVVPRPGAQCPRCGALERHRLLWLWLRDRTDVFTSPVRLLHLAPEPVLRERFERQANLDYVTVDLQSPLADLRADVQRLPFPTGAFDAVIANHVLEHVDDDRAAMVELGRVLRPGGWAVLQVPLDETRETTFEDPAVTDPAARERLFGKDDHVRVYGRDYGQRLRDAGFEVRPEPFARTLGPQAMRRYGLLDEDVYACRTRA